MAIYNSNNLPCLILNICKGGSKFCQILNKHLKIAKEFLNFTKVAKFRQIWSHWARHRGNNSFKLHNVLRSGEQLDGSFSSLCFVPNANLRLLCVTNVLCEFLFTVFWKIIKFDKIKTCSTPTPTLVAFIWTKNAMPTPQSTLRRFPS